MDPNDDILDPPSNPEEFWYRMQYCMHCHISGYVAPIIDTWEEHLNRSPVCKIREIHAQ